MDTKTVVMQLITSMIASFGFAMVFNVRIRHLLLAALGGMASWGVYLVIDYLSDSIFFATLIASIFCAVYAETMARLKKTPANQYLIAALIPLLPGAALYYSMSMILQKDVEQTRFYVTETISYAMGIAMGISIVWAFLDIIRQIERKRTK